MIAIHHGCQPHPSYDQWRPEPDDCDLVCDEDQWFSSPTSPINLSDSLSDSGTARASVETHQYLQPPVSLAREVPSLGKTGGRLLCPTRAWPHPPIH